MKIKIDSQMAPRPFSRQAAVFLCLAAAMTFVVSNTAQASFNEFTASAYGTYAFVGSTVTVGKTAPISIGTGCGTPAANQSTTGTVTQVAAPPLITTGVINTSAATSANASTATSDVHNINLLGGLITADEVKALSTTSHDASGFHTSAAGSKFVDLVIHQSPPTVILSGTTAPNTTIQLTIVQNGALKSIGRVVLNEQSASVSSTYAQLTVNMIHVYITADATINGVTVKAGTQIIVSDAFSALRAISGVASLDGNAYGTSIASTTIHSSPTAPVSIGCLGTPLTTVSQVGINVPNVLASGTISDTAQGSVSASLASSETTTTVQNVNLLNGVITASVVHGDAKGTTTNGTTFNFTQSGSFTNLHVSGHPEIAANLTGSATVSLTLNGKPLGTLYLHRVLQNPNSITVRMIDLYIAAGNSLGLPAGMEIIVGYASASLHSPAHP